MSECITSFPYKNRSYGVATQGNNIKLTYTYAAQDFTYAGNTYVTVKQCKLIGYHDLGL